MRIIIGLFGRVLSAYSIAGEMAEQKTSLPGTFQIEFINSLYAIQSEEVEENKKVIHYE
ncbi:Hydroxyethylthiazole kinase [Streptococcus suis 98HAH33]|nr:Hydroxyethylthiazole kinase [Streptococcus suis 98HAH33]